MVLLSRANPWALLPGYQKYAWGDVGFIPELFGFIPDGEPYAEAWLGAHARLPARVVTPEAELPLDELLSKDPVTLLGAKVASAYGTLPYLLKVLAADRPLSIQVHPTRQQAEQGFARENEAGIALDAPHRNYRDDNHKPELLVALTPFFALSGFRPLEEIDRYLMDVPELRRELPGLGAEPKSLKALVQSYLALEPQVQSAALSAWLERLERRVGHNVTADLTDWVLAAHRVTVKDGVPDPGLFFFLILQLLELEPGQGLFMAAGVPHAYLKGAGVEVMANSDNVLRCGLTSKHTDPKELMRIVRFDAPPTALLVPEPVPDSSTARQYRTPASEFSLCEVSLAANARLAQRAQGPQILLAVDRRADVQVVTEDIESSLFLKGGSACFIPHGAQYALHARAQTRIMRVSVPDA